MFGQPCYVTAINRPKPENPFLPELRVMRCAKYGTGERGVVVRSDKIAADSLPCLLIS